MSVKESMIIDAGSEELELRATAMSDEKVTMNVRLRERRAFIES